MTSCRLLQVNNECWAFFFLSLFQSFFHSLLQNRYVCKKSSFAISESLSHCLLTTAVHRWKGAMVLKLNRNMHHVTLMWQNGEASQTFFLGWSQWAPYWSSRHFICITSKLTPILSQIVLETCMIAFMHQKEKKSWTESIVQSAYKGRTSIFPVISFRGALSLFSSIKTGQTTLLLHKLEFIRIKSVLVS